MRLQLLLCLSALHNVFFFLVAFSLSPSQGLQALPITTSKAVTQLSVSPVSNTERQLSISAIIVSQVTCDLPVNPVPFGLDWVHLDGLPLADPDFGLPGRIDALLNVDVFINTLLSSRHSGPSPPPGLQLPLRLSLAGYLVAV